METTKVPGIVARQIAFFAPVDMKGKWHAAWNITHTAVCGVSVELSREVIRSVAGEEASKIHPIVCRRCIRLSTRPGVSATGMER